MADFDHKSGLLRTWQLSSKSKGFKTLGRIVQSSGDGEFDLFWSNYPKRVKKILALKEWRKLRNVSISAILDGIEQWKQSAQWQHIEYVPDPERFLKYRRWEDEVPIDPRVARHLAEIEEAKFYDAPLKPEVLARIRKREEAQRMKAKT